MAGYFYSNFRTGKTFMIQQWDHLKCKECGGETELVKVNDFEEVKQCKECGKRHMLIKKVRKQ